MPGRQRCTTHRRTGRQRLTSQQSTPGAAPGARERQTALVRHVAEKGAHGPGRCP